MRGYSKPSIEAELGPLASGEVEHHQLSLVPRAAEPAPELLEKDRRTLGRSKEQEGVDVGDVDALVEKVDDTQDL